MTQEIEILIENVRKYKFLCDSSHEHFKSVLKEAEAWNEIAEELNITSVTVFYDVLFILLKVISKTFTNLNSSIGRLSIC